MITDDPKQDVTPDSTEGMIEQPVPAPVVTTPVSTAPDPSDNDLVATLKIQLNAFTTAMNRAGRLPEEFKQAAKLSLQFTRFAIQYPKVAVLDTLLAYFTEHLDTTCKPENYLQGSTYLSASDEQQVAVLFNLFSGLAHRQLVKINTGMITQVFKKPEIANYYNRRMAAIAQNKAS